MQVIHLNYNKDKHLSSSMALEYGQWVLTIRQKDWSLMIAFDTLIKSMDNE